MTFVLLACVAWLAVGLFATEVFARVGGGGSYGGGGGGGHGGGGGGGALVYLLIRFLLWLTIEHPVIGIPVDIIVTGAAPDIYWDPIDPALRDDPYPLWKRLRDEAPAYHNERYDFWALSRFDDVEAAHKDPRRFSSAHGINLEMMSPQPYPESGQFIMLDPPHHTRLRALVSRAFTPRAINSFEDRAREIAAGLLDAQAGNDGFDYVQDFGAIIPPTVISSLLGVPESVQPELREQVDLLFHIEDGVGMINPTALAVGTLMNARGLMELIILNIGLQKGIIQPALFSMMVLMAIVTTLMASPVFELVYGRRARQKGDLGAAPREA